MAKRSWLDQHRHGKSLWKKVRRRPAESLLAAIFFLALAGAMGWFSYGSSIERSRITALRTQVGHLAKQGREAADDGLYDQAVQHMTQAWQLVQAEPALSDLSLGVEGWLDHCQRAASVELWSGRVPPRDFDQLRDDAVIDSLMLEPKSTEAFQWAQDSIHQARELTEGEGTIDELAWKPQRELLDLLEAKLIADIEGPEVSKQFLRTRPEYNTRLYWESLSELRENSQSNYKNETLAKALRFPPDVTKQAWLRAVSDLRMGRFDEAEKHLEQVISQEPANFSARLLQGIGYSHVGRFAEGKISLTACIAQRPTSAWSYYWRATVQIGLKDYEAAKLDLQRAGKLKRSPTLQFMLEKLSSDLGNDNDPNS